MLYLALPPHLDLRHLTIACLNLTPDQPHQAQAVRSAADRQQVRPGRVRSTSVGRDCGRVRAPPRYDILRDQRHHRRRCVMGFSIIGCLYLQLRLNCLFSLSPCARSVRRVGRVRHAHRSGGRRSAHAARARATARQAHSHQCAAIARSGRRRRGTSVAAAAVKWTAVFENAVWSGPVQRDSVWQHFSSIHQSCYIIVQ